MALESGRHYINILELLELRDADEVSGIGHVVPTAFPSVDERIDAGVSAVITW